MRSFIFSFSSPYSIPFIFISTVIITYISILISKKLGFFNEYLINLNRLINFLNLFLIISVCLVFLYLFIDQISESFTVLCMTDNEPNQPNVPNPNTIATLDAKISDVKVQTLVKTIGDVTVFTAAMKSITSLIQKLPATPMVIIGLLGAGSGGILFFYNTLTYALNYKEKVEITAREVDFKVKINKTKYEIERNSSASDSGIGSASGSKNGSVTNINSPLEDGEDRLGELLKIIDDTVFLSLWCVLLNYFLLLHYFLKYLADRNFEFIKKIPFIGNKLYLFVSKVAPFWKKSNNLIFIYGFVCLFFFLISLSYLLYFISHQIHVIFDLIK
jgi:hypothetical protein